MIFELKMFFLNQLYLLWGEAISDRNYSELDFTMNSCKILLCRLKVVIKYIMAMCVHVNTFISSIRNRFLFMNFV